MPQCLCLGQHWAQCSLLGTIPSTQALPGRSALAPGHELGAWGSSRVSGCSPELRVMQEGRV